MRHIVVLLLMAASLGSTIGGQTVKKVAKPPSLIPLTLDDVLSCASDKWITTAWSMKQIDMMSSEALLVTMHKLDKKNPEIYTRPFVSRPVEDSEGSYSLMPENPNDKTAEKDFCHSMVQVRYEKDNYKATPLLISITFNEERWKFDFAELLRHADQFTWKSGVFSNSSEIYLSETKGNCTLQFLVSSGKPKLYRVLFDSPL